MSLRQHQLGDLALACGHTLPEAQLTYLQIGELNADRCNLILVPTSIGARPDNVAAQRQLLREVFEVEWICCVCGTARSGSHSGPVPRRLTSQPIVVSCRPSRRPISARLCPSLCRSSICALCSSLRPSLNKRSRFITHPEPFGHSR